MKAGIIRGEGKGKVVIRVRSAQPYTAEITSQQLRTLAEVARRYGSRVVHTTPRQAIEIPDVEESLAGEAIRELEEAGFKAGASGALMRNAFACSRWCLYNSTPVAEIAKKVNQKYGNVEMPAKLTISFSGCDFSCARSRTSDIGVIAKTRIEVEAEKCIKCGLCVNDPLGCQVAALTVSKTEPVRWDRDKCVGCGFCSNICPVGSITAQEKGFDIYIGGGGGIFPREAELLKEFVSEERVLGEVEGIVEKYRALAKPGERLFSVVERLGVEEFGRDG
ncbi:4Fe-4S binding protein [Candidatus Pyrohabitans sp.]